MLIGQPADQDRWADVGSDLYQFLTIAYLFTWYAGQSVNPDRWSVDPDPG